MANDRTKLPQWAQREFELLEMRLEGYRAEIHRLRGEGVPNVFYHDILHTLGRTAAPADRFDFVLGPDRLRNRVMVELQGDHLYLNAGDRLVIAPESSNVARIYVRREV